MATNKLDYVYKINEMRNLLESYGYICGHDEPKHFVEEYFDQRTRLGSRHMCLGSLMESIKYIHYLNGRYVGMAPNELDLGHDTSGMRVLRYRYDHPY